MVMNGDTGQLALAHADANRQEIIKDKEEANKDQTRRRRPCSKEAKTTKNCLFLKTSMYRKCERCRCPLCMDPNRFDNPLKLNQHQLFSKLSIQAYKDLVITKSIQTFNKMTIDDYQ